MATSRSFQTQRNWKMAKEASAGRKRQDDLREDLEIARTIDTRAFDDLLRQADDVVAQQIDGERQAEGGMREPDAGIGLRWHAEEGADIVVRGAASGISDICSGTTMRPTTAASSSVRPLKLIHESA